jgi:hypothetical protein
MLSSHWLPELEARAAAIPTMEREDARQFVRETVRQAPRNTCVVEIGVWLGALTAYMAIGDRERRFGMIPIHCYDSFTTKGLEAHKAAQVGVTLADGQDTLPLAQEYLRPFGAPIHFHKGDIREATWNGEPISLHVDDAAKRAKLFFPMLRTFSPSWIPGQTVVVLLDITYWKRSQDAAHRCQHQFIEAHPDHFEKIRDVSLCGAAFLYKRPLDLDELPNLDKAGKIL